MGVVDNRAGVGDLAVQEFSAPGPARAGRDPLRRAVAEG
jgi:hypothetical protein